MSQAYKCDICGEFYEKDVPLVVNKDIDAYFYRKGFTKEKILCDICPGCITAIQKAIDGRKKGGDSDLC